ncbi:hypothetical protein [Rhizobium leguminosarum]|nr:hypothetical protein [Rhizobium leguminosarum]
MAIGEARYDRYSIFGVVMYSKISGSTGTPPRDRGLWLSPAG